MTEERPRIPTDLRRRVLVESGHRCAIPTCRHIDIDIHHIIPWSSSPTHRYEDLIALCPNCHRRADRGEIDRRSLRLYKANLRFTHDRFSQFEVDTLFELYAQPDEGNLLIPECLGLLIKRLLDAGYVRFGTATGGIALGDQWIVKNPLKLHITKEGRDYVNSLSLIEL